MNQNTNSLKPEIISVDFNHKVQKLWKELWPNRENIKAMSSLTINGEIDMEIYKKYKPTFWLLQTKKEEIGCVSGHPSSEESFRLRGLYIREKYRGKGFSHKLLSEALFFAKKSGYKLVWTLPRVSVSKVYESVGFYRCSKNIYKNMVKGPNALFICPLRPEGEE